MSGILHPLLSTPPGQVMSPGAQIAGHIANAGIPSLLFDVNNDLAKKNDEQAFNSASNNVIIRSLYHKGRSFFWSKH